MTKEELTVEWFMHYNSIKSNFLFDVVKNSSEETYIMAWEVLHVFSDYAEKHFDSLTEESVYDIMSYR